MSSRSPPYWTPHTLTCPHAPRVRMLIHIRLDTDRSHPILDYLSTVSDDWLVTSEKEADNPHLHIMLETDVSSNALRERLRRAGFAGNKSYSVSEVRKGILPLGAYLIKDGDIVKNSYDPYLTQLFYDYDTALKADMKTKKKTSVLASIIASLDPEDLQSPIILSPPKCQRIQDAILKYHIENKLLIRRFVLKTYYETILAYYDTSNLSSLRDYIFA